MLSKIVYTTDTHEIEIKKTDDGKWSLDIYNIKHGSKEIKERHVLRSYKTAMIFVEERYLKKDRVAV